ncbi:methyltransferase domain-containing protein [candidate division GN15 bacterium]|jgi:demethylmenaquinone methyltransferase/2-methoxy-6-polyprenyl-1,4-benzoquinol methylase|nr:methyltransferase domain-containing protein [candidate division GN15 bacterium]
MSHDKHQEFYDSLAAEWDLMFTAEDLERLSHLVDTFEIEPGYDVLDLGCGTGILFDMLRRRVGPEGTVTGVDFSFQMARRAHRNFPFDNVNVVDADATNLPFRADTFDMAFSFSSFDNFSDQRKALDEAHRVLKPGANFCIIYLVSSHELSDQHKQAGGVLAGDKLPTRERMGELFDVSHFDTVRIDDQPGLYFACAINVK